MILKLLGIFTLVWIFFHYLPEILETADKCLG